MLSSLHRLTGVHWCRPIAKKATSASIECAAVLKGEQPLEDLDDRTVVDLQDWSPSAWRSWLGSGEHASRSLLLGVLYIKSTSELFIIITEKSISSSSSTLHLLNQR
eukprot:TRINITY_DN26691_c0_g1_i1.p3 TRINITY_DN26691_c0_g1~~TRINITY_DN26691_c0_g1_i1.p3  ORF type:complete len:107 (+),score=11.14 TRINITY_DN26691_c0_g1_i1:573-893(+)